MEHAIGRFALLKVVWQPLGFQNGILDTGLLVYFEHG